MVRILTIAVGLLLMTVPLVGCIGSDSTDDPTNAIDPNTVVDPAVADNLAVLHKANAEATGPVDLASLFGDGVPLPAGLGREITAAEIFEPTIGVTSDGTLFVASFDGGIPGHTSVQRSTDQGLSWEDVTPMIGPVGVPPNSNDPYLYVDPVTDRVYNLDMQGLACNFIKWSDDLGETWTHAPLGCGQPPVLDHPTLFAGKPTAATTVGYENVVYLCVNRVADSACATSLDGGMTWLGFYPVFPGLDPEGGLCGGLHGHGTTGPDGKAYLPKGQCGTPMVAITEDNGLTWDLVTISDEVGVGGHEVAFAVDEAGNAYAFWIGDDRLPFYAASTDGGFTWGTPKMVAPPGVKTTDFPTIAAGADGRVALAYIGTEAEKAYGDMDAEDTWNAYITVIVDATSDDPVLATSTANDPADPIARGVCGGSRCFGADGGSAIGDFIDIVIDKDGRPWAAFADVCTDDCVDDIEGENDFGVGFVGTLSQGPALTGQTLGALPALMLEADHEDDHEHAGADADLADTGLPVTVDV